MGSDRVREPSGTQTGGLFLVEPADGIGTGVLLETLVKNWIFLDKQRINNLLIPQRGRYHRIRTIFICDMPAQFYTKIMQQV